MAYTPLPTRTDADANAAADVNQLQENIADTRSVQAAYALENATKNAGFWGEVVYKDSDEIVIKTKKVNGNNSIGAFLNDGTFLTSSTDITVKLDVPGSSGHILDGITAKLTNEWYILWAYEDSGGNLAFGFTWMPNATFSNANPTTTLTLNQINSQDIGLLFPEDAELVVWQDADEWETTLAYQDGGAVTYDATRTDPSISSRTSTVLTLNATLDNSTFTASSSVYQVSNFKPLAVDDGLIVDAIGARGYIDTGIRVRTDGTPDILEFIIYDDVFRFDADVDIYSTDATTITLRNTYCPPDKQTGFYRPYIRNNGGTSSFSSKEYYSTTLRNTILSYDRSRTELFLPTRHSLLTIRFDAATDRDFMILGYKI